ncbi:MAG: hypothetical protein ACOYOT_04460 [Bacteroidales bacterium]
MKLTKSQWALIVFVIFIIEIANMLFITEWEKETKTLIIEFATMLVTGAGFAMVIYGVFKKEKDFLDTSIETKSEGNYHTIKTQVFNKSELNKDVTYALLFISKQGVDPVSAMNESLSSLDVKLRITKTNYFEFLKEQINSPRFVKNAAIIPLSFYYSENVWIANENPAFSYAFNSNCTNTKLENGIYTVRFFIFCEGKLHRSTADSLRICNYPENKNCLPKEEDNFSSTNPNQKTNEKQKRP